MIVDIPNKNKIKHMIKLEMKEQTIKQYDKLALYVNDLAKEIDRLREEIKIIKINQKV